MTVSTASLHAEKRWIRTSAEILRVVALVVGALLGVLGAMWIGAGEGGLGQALLTHSDLASETTAPSPTWATMSMVNALALSLLVGRPRGRGGGRVDWIAVAGALWVVMWLVLLSVLRMAFAMSDTDAVCVRAGCWPHGWQEFAVAVPLGAGALTLLGVGLVSRTWPWWLRRGLPAGVYIILTIVQLAIWDRFVIPFFLGPSPLT